jgi:YD repeat-containing protein
MRPMARLAVVIVLVVLSVRLADAATIAQLDAARDKGLAWLVTHQRPDGSWRSVSGTEVVATSTAIEAFAIANVKTEPLTAGVAWLGNATMLSVDSLARQVTALSMVGLDMKAGAQTLLSWRNGLSAWGAYEGFETTYPDTALALQAIRTSQQPLAEADLKTALCRILVSQRTGAPAVAGGWAYTYADALRPVDPPAAVSAPAILPTVYNLLEIHAIAQATGWTSVTDCQWAPVSSYTLTTVVNDGVNWLTTQKKNADGGFGDDGVSTPLETALAYHVLATIAPTHAAVTPALDYLVLSTQRPDGSWNGDVFQTALVLKVIPIGTPYADSDTDGIPDRVETELQTNPSVADSRWLAPTNGLSSIARPSPANNFGLVTASFTGAGPRSDLLGLTATSRPTSLHPRPASAPARAAARLDALALTMAVDAFTVDLYTGAAVAEIPIAVPPGAGGVAPNLVLRYDSVSADALTASDPAQGTGLGWSLLNGPVVVRDHKGTTATTDDVFTLVLAGKRYELAVVDSALGIYHTKDETFLKLQFNTGTDVWTLTTKDGTRYELGGTAGSRQSTRVVAPWTTSVTYRYLLSSVTSTSGVVINYTYTKDTATISGQSYDQSIYPDTITYAVVGGSTLGVGRQITFLWSPRTDWPAAGTTPQHFDKKKLDWIEVRIGGNLARKYGLTYDYTSIDRAPGVTWAGGATGDLALRTVTVFGIDGATALPTATFGYHSASGRMTSASNGLGGQATYAYATLTTTTLYSVCTTSACADRGVCIHGNPAGFPTAPILGYLLASTDPDTTTIYSVCKTAGGFGGCADWGVGTTASGAGPTLMGYAHSTSLPQLSGTIGLYSVNQGGWRAVTAQPSSPPTGGTLLGYIYQVNPDRYARVASLSLSDGRTAPATTTYAFSDLALNADGSVRGYASTRVIDPAANYVDRYFHQTDDRSGRMYRMETYTGSTLLRKTDNTWSVSQPHPATAPSVKLAVLTQADETTYDGGVTLVARRTWQYDAYANVTVDRSEGFTTITGDEREERTDWLVDAATWIHRPSRLALYTAGGSVLQERWLSYDNLAWGSLGTRGLITRDEQRLAGGLGAAGNAVSLRDYDTYGNLTIETDPGSCTTTTAYQAPSHAVPLSTTTCLGHVTTFGHDSYERRTSVSDPNNQLTTYAFDTLGRLTRVTGPLDTGGPDGSLTVQYVNWGTPTGQAVRVLRPKLHGQSATVATDEFFDGRGRVYARYTSGPSAGQFIGRVREYNARGWLAQRSAPHLVGIETPVWTVYSYDALGRLTNVAYPDGTAAARNYANVAGIGNWVAATDERGITTFRFYDAHGQLARIDEPTGGVATYTYDAAGALTTVTQGTMVTTLGYDPMGRHTSLNDPNLGDWSWTWDTRGNLTSRTDARSQTVTFTYDQQSRVKTKTYPGGGGQVVWTYDQPNPSAPYTTGRLTALVDTVASTTFTYDPLGRITQSTRTIDGTPYTTSQGYDAAGRVISRGFPDGDGATFVYNDAGWLERVPGLLEGPGGTAGVLYDARGQRTEVRYANGVASTFAHHPQNFRLTRLLTVAPSGTLQNFSYDYDAAGNLVKVTDSVGTGTRTFAYDGSNRLVRAAGWLGGVTEDYTYDVHGNVVRHASLLYAYSDLLHPWAATAVADGRSYAYDANGNATSADSRQLTWDADGRLLTIEGEGGPVAYAYDASGRAIQTTLPFGTVRAPFPDYEVPSSGAPRKWIAGIVKQGNRVIFYHDDHLGSTHVISDVNGFETQRVEHDAWGEVTRSEGSTDLAPRFRTADGAHAGRHYDPALARMLSVEPTSIDVGDPQTTNPYTYARNNPATPIVRRPGADADGF